MHNDSGGPARDAFEVARRAAGLGFEFPERFAALAKPGIHWEATEAASGVGASRWGGEPDLPAGTAWPMWRGSSLAFVAQLNLAEVTADARLDGWPTAGVVSLFYDCEQSTWGFDPDDRGSFVALFTRDTETLEQRNAPPDLDLVSQPPPLGLFPRRVATLPSLGAEAADSLGLGRNDDDTYATLVDTVSGIENELGGRVLSGGYPNLIQGEMEVECAMVTAGVSSGSGESWRDPRLEKWRADALEWVLLAQIPSRDDGTAMWGDDGALYFWIRRSDLAATRFEHAWMILQSY